MKQIDSDDFELPPGYWMLGPGIRDAGYLPEEPEPGLTLILRTEEWKDKAFLARVVRKYGRAVPQESVIRS